MRGVDLAALQLTASAAPPMDRPAGRRLSAEVTMPPRSQWNGFLKLSLVSVPVKAYGAMTSGGGGISLNQLHAECNSRIQYKKTCPVHGELKSEDIVSGYQFDKDQYVMIDPEVYSSGTMNQTMYK